MSDQQKKLRVVCPICKKSFYYFSVESRPFCSERCKLIDLARWSSGEYQLPSNEPLSEVDIEEVIRAQAGEIDEDY